MTNLIKKAILTTLSFACLCFSFSAQADFRRALDAYIARDGDAMLKEVKHAVDTKNNDGLLLFLNIVPRRYVGVKNPTCVEYRDLLNEKQTVELRKLLDQAASNGSSLAGWVHFNQPKLSYRLNDKWVIWRQAASEGGATAKKATEQWSAISDKEIDRLAKKGSVEALRRLFEEAKHAKKKSELLEKAAQDRDPFMAISMAFRHLHWRSDYYYSHAGCKEEINGLACLPFDENKARRHLNEAMRHVVSQPMYYSGFMLEMGDYELSTHQGKRPNPEQAFLWYRWGLNSMAHGLTTEGAFIERLKRMKDSGMLSIADKALDKAWNNQIKREALLYPVMLNGLPNLAKQALKKNDYPIFEYIDAGTQQYSVRLYQDGRVYIHFLWNSTTPQVEEIYTQKTQVEIKRFMDELNRLKFYEWPLTSPHYGKDMACTSRCVSSHYMGLVNYKGTYKAAIMSQDDESPVDMKKKKRIDSISSLVQKHLLMDDAKRVLSCK